MTALLVILTVVMLVAVDATRLYLKRRREVTGKVPQPVLAFAPANPPRGLFLDGSHTWVRMADSGEMRIGVDELITQALGGADRVELPDLGTKVRRGQPLATLWRNGRKFSVASPVDGTVVTSNDSLEHMPSDLASDPYGSGWLTTIWPVEHREALKPFTMGEAAKRWMDREVQRLSDFLAANATGQPGLALAADGAHPAVGAASTLEDDAWKEFQHDFASVREN
jgi:glycine cleavage system H protein